MKPEFYWMALSIVLSACDTKADGGASQRTVAAQMAGDLYIDPPVIDMGAIPVGAGRTRSAHLVNATDRDFQIQGIAASCTCSEPLVQPQTVIAGATLEIPVHYSAVLRGKSVVALTVQGVFVGEPRLVQVHAKIRAVGTTDILVEPPRLVFVGNTEGSDLQRTLSIHQFRAATDPPLQVKSVTCADGAITIEHKGRVEEAAANGLTVVRESYIVHCRERVDVSLARELLVELVEPARTITVPVVWNGE